MSPTVMLDDAGPANIVFVVGGIQVEKATNPVVLSALRRLAQRHASLGSRCTGGYARSPWR
ncbi:MAG TPA: hypothetical protein PLY50_13010 [Burkholderiaceae bacterium]|nr:hypothetical protein [Burkholderiaceae bacterium]